MPTLKRQCTLKVYPRHFPSKGYSVVQHMNIFLIKTPSFDSLTKSLKASLVWLATQYPLTFAE